MGDSLSHLDDLLSPSNAFALLGTSRLNGRALENYDM